MSLDAAAGHTWLERWWWGIPDIEVRYCNLTEAPDHTAYEHGLILYHQTAFAAGAYILEHPSEKPDWEATYLVGLQGALHTYESILRQQPNKTYRWLDELRQKRDRGDLPDTVHQLVIDRKCDVK